MDVASGVRQRRQRKVDDDDDDEVVEGKGLGVSPKWMVVGARPVARLAVKFRWKSQRW